MQTPKVSHLLRPSHGRRPLLPHGSAGRRPPSLALPDLNSTRRPLLIAEQFLWRVRVHTRPIRPCLSINVLASFVWHPRCLHSRIVLILCIMCLCCLKKDFIVKIKGYLCKYDFMQGPFYSLIWVRGENIAFVEGLFVNFSVIIAW